jgi:D-sedoheptulose 7-phosphate isomerase
MEMSVADCRGVGANAQQVLDTQALPHRMAGDPAHHRLIYDGLLDEQQAPGPLLFFSPQSGGPAPSRDQAPCLRRFRPLNRTHPEALMPSDGKQSELQALIAETVQKSIALKNQLVPLYPAMARAATLLSDCYRRGNQAIFFGNGGSAADAQHLAAELSGRFQLDRRALPALALGINASALTAISNDLGYDQLFARELSACARPGDVAVAISTSGSSPNVVAAAATKSELGIALIALTGDGGGKLAEHADVLLAVPSRSVPRIQEVHILMGHLLCEWVERSLFSA